MTIAMTPGEAGAAVKLKGPHPGQWRRERARGSSEVTRAEAQWGWSLGGLIWGLLSLM